MTNFLTLSTLAWSSILSASHTGAAPAAYVPISKSETTLSAKTDEPTDPWKLSGYVDLSQQSTSTSKFFTSGVNRSVFDVHPAGNSNLAVTLANVPKKGLGATINVTGGDAANVLNGTYGENFGGSYLDLTQLFIQYATDKVTFTAGKFVTFAGEEVIASPGNWNFSRSILFGYAIPFTHTGVRATFAPSSTVSATVGANYGWDQMRDSNKDATLEGQLSYTPNSTWSLVANGYVGKENVATGPTIASNRTLIDLVGTYNFNPSTTLVLNYDYAQQDNFDAAGNRAKWNGIAGYLHHSFNDKWSATVRLEHFEDPQGVRTGVPGMKWDEGTLTVAYTPDAAHEYRLEGRVDNTNKSVIWNKDFTDVKKSATTIAGQFLWKF